MGVTINDPEFDQAVKELVAVTGEPEAISLKPARLNFGDCFAYALAKSRNEPLLFKGNDFSLADLILV